MSWAVLQSAVDSASEYYDPDNTVDLLGLLIIIAPPTITAAATAAVVLRGQRRGHARWKQDRETLNEVRDQVSNDHEHEPKPNLRDDIGEIRGMVKSIADRQIAHGRDIRGIREEQAEVRKDIGGLHGEVRDDRTDLHSLERRVQEFARREHPDAPPL